MILLNPSARTKGLYKIERLFIERDKQNKPLNVDEVEDFGNWIWKKERWHLYHGCPRIDVKPIEGLSHCLARSEIILRPADVNHVVLIHELTHGKGYGSYTNPHTIGFVKQYFELLVKYAGFDKEYLYFLGATEKLI